MESITFNCEIITPMFLGNAEPKGSNGCELRPSAIKGALRFWWRAMQTERDWKKLLERENSIFGSAGDEEGKGGRSKVIIDVELRSGCQPTNNGFHEGSQKVKRVITGTTRKFYILGYLGYGAMEYVGGERGYKYRHYLPVGGEFEIRLQYSSAVLNAQELKDYFYLMSIFGGLGSKSRNGFGRFKVTNHQFDYSQAGVCAFVNGLKQNPRASWTAVSQDLGLFKTTSTGDWKAALGSLGKVYLVSRTAFPNGAGTTNGFEAQHSWNKRPYLGAPVLEGKNSHLPKLSIATANTAKIDRHAKLHFFGVTKDNDCNSYLLHLPYHYLENLPDSMINPTLNSAQSQFQTHYNNYIIGGPSVASSFNQKLIANGLLKLI